MADSDADVFEQAKRIGRSAEPDDVFDAAKTSAAATVFDAAKTTAPVRSDPPVDIQGRRVVTTPEGATRVLEPAEPERKDEGPGFFEWLLSGQAAQNYQTFAKRLTKEGHPGLASAVQVAALPAEIAAMPKAMLESPPGLAAGQGFAFGAGAGAIGGPVAAGISGAAGAATGAGLSLVGKALGMQPERAPAGPTDPTPGEEFVGGRLEDWYRLTVPRDVQESEPSTLLPGAPAPGEATGAQRFAERGVGYLVDMLPVAGAVTGVVRGKVVGAAERARRSGEKFVASPEGTVEHQERPMALGRDPVVERVAADPPTPKPPPSAAYPSVLPVAEPTFPDVVTGKKYPIQFTGEAKQSRLHRESAKRKKLPVGATQADPMGAFSDSKRIAQEDWARTKAAIKATTGFLGHDRVISFYEKYYAPFQRAAGIMPALDFWRTRVVDPARQGAARFMDAGPVRAGLHNVVRGLTMSGAGQNRTLQKFVAERQILRDRAAEQLERDVKALQEIPEDVAKAFTLKRIGVKNEDGSTGFPLPDLDEHGRAVMESKDPMVRGLFDRFAALGQRLVDHDYISANTYDFRKDTYFPRVYDSTRSAMQEALVRAGRVRETPVTETVQQGRSKGRTKTDTDYVAEGSLDARRLIANGYYELTQIVDRLDIMRDIAQQPTLARPKSHIAKEQRLRSEQLKAIADALSGDAVSMADAMRRIRDKAEKTLALRRDVFRAMGLEETAAQPEIPAAVAEQFGLGKDGIIGIDRDLVRLQDRRAALEKLAQEGIRDLKQAVPHIAQKEKALADMATQTDREAKAAGLLSPEEWAPKIGRSAEEAKGREFGALADAWLSPEIVGDLEMFYPRSRHWVETKLFEPATAIWEMGLTRFYKRSHANNSLGNSVFATLGRFPLKAQAPYVAKALNRIVGDDRAYIEQARRDGVRLSPSVSDARIRKALSAFNNVRDWKESLVEAKRWLEGTAPARAYGVGDDMWRLAMYDYAKGVMKMAPEAAAEHANYWVIDSSNAPPAIKALRRGTMSIFNLPFLSYSSQALPKLIRGAAENPVMFGFWTTLGASSLRVASALGAVSEKDADRRWDLRSMTDKIGTVTMPWRGDSGAPAELSIVGAHPVAAALPRGGIPESLPQSAARRVEEAGDPTRAFLSATIPEAALALDYTRARLDGLDIPQRSLPGALQNRVNAAGKPRSPEETARDLILPWLVRDVPTKRMAKRAAGAASEETRAEGRSDAGKVRDARRTGAERRRATRETRREYGLPR